MAVFGTVALACGATLLIAFLWPLHETDWQVTVQSALSRFLLLGLIWGTLWGLVSFQEQNNSIFTAAPVIFENNTSLLETFQALDFLTLQGITAASVYSQAHSMCGAPRPAVRLSGN